MRQYLYILGMIALMLLSCEERYEVEAEFPTEDDVVFCEFIGAAGFGFWGQITLLREVNSGFQESDLVSFKIWEENREILDTTLTFGSFMIPYFVNEDSQYKLEVSYRNQIIESSTERLPKSLSTSNYMVNNAFVDSLGFDVATISLQIDNEANEEIFYLVNYLLLENELPMLSLNSAEEADSIAAGKTVFLQKRLPNIEQLSHSQTTIISIDRGMFQYLKSIQGFGSIPNDNLEGHQGNLDNALGYFGLIRLTNFINRLE